MSGQGEPGAERAHPLLVRLGGGVVLPGSRTAGSLPTVASWLPIPPHDLLLVRLHRCGDSVGIKGPTCSVRHTHQ